MDVIVSYQKDVLYMLDIMVLGKVRHFFFTTRMLFRFRDVDDTLCGSLTRSAEGADRFHH